MGKYYFTYGSEGHPYVGGWTEITAPTMSKAIELFHALHPAEGGLPCAFIYPEEDFLRSRMSERGNFGHSCHERLTYELLTEGECRNAEAKT